MHHLSRRAASPLQKPRPSSRGGPWSGGSARARTYRLLKLPAIARQAHSSALLPRGVKSRGKLRAGDIGRKRSRGYARNWPRRKRPARRARSREAARIGGLANRPRRGSLAESSGGQPRARPDTPAARSRPPRNRVALMPRVLCARLAFSLRV